ncbi:hypothetical protein ACJIZ3_003969 [Penstemon smallii]|uniref:Glycosyltransferase n=1 Tax=Penstemon smallii TaxID=265156 RepID=A0ABD3S0P7_9LAMI
MSTVKPHAVCLPIPAQGHINPMLKLAKLLHSKGFYITFVQIAFDKLQNSGFSSKGINGSFQFQTISDGLPPDNQRGVLDLPSLAYTMPVHGLKSFRELIEKLNSPDHDSDSPPVTCIISDGGMGFSLKVAQEFNIPGIIFYTLSACGMLGYLYYQKLIEMAYFPLKDESDLCNGYLDKTIEWTPSMGTVRLRDLPTFLRTTNPDDILFHHSMESAQNAVKNGHLILNTFEELEKEVLDILKSKVPNLYTIGPLCLLSDQICQPELNSITSNLWKEDERCLEWLDTKEPKSVVYVNYGSFVIMTPKQLTEFAWGLANSKFSFLWVIRPNLVEGGPEAISGDFLNEVKDRGLILDWCSQEKVLGHSSIGGFLTHCGWNSILESISNGVPMICWPFFAEQQLNCLYLCKEWGIGMEIDVNVERSEVESLVRELMEGEKGIKMKEKIVELKNKAGKATQHGGSSYIDFDLLVGKLKGEIPNSSQL